MQPFLGDRSCRDAPCRLARRSASAAAMIADAVFLPVGVVGVAGAEGVGDIAVILAALVFVADEQRDGCAGGLAFEHAGQYLHRVRFAALRDVARGAGFAAVEVMLDVGLAQLHSRRATVDDAADGRAVRFAERGDGEERAECVSRHDVVSLNECVKFNIAHCVTAVIPGDRGHPVSLQCLAQRAASLELQ